MKRKKKSIVLIGETIMVILTILVFLAALAALYAAIKDGNSLVGIFGIALLLGDFSIWADSEV